MSRIWTLAVFLAKDLFRSLAGIGPLAASVAFGLIAFEYGMDQAQFITVGGVGIGVICSLTTLLLASRADRAASYPLMGRLKQRTELLAALVLSSLGITSCLAVVIVVGNLIGHRLTLHFPSALWILPTWLALWSLTATLALPLSALASRRGTNLVACVLLTALVVANDRLAYLRQRNLDWIVRAVTAILWPPSTLLSRASAGSYGSQYFVTMALTFACAAVLFALAAESFERKDLLWAE